MIRPSRIVLLSTLLPSFVMGDTSTRLLCSSMLTDLKACFSEELAPKSLINDWKWGSIKFAFAFDFAHTVTENQNFCCIYMAGHGEVEASTEEWRAEYPKVRDLCWYDGPRYLMFGVKTSHESKKQSLVFVYCAKTYDTYPDFLSILNLCEPSYEEVEMKHPAQCWNTTVYDKQRFLNSQDEDSYIDDLFVHWGTLGSNLDVVYRFNQKKCIGVMLVPHPTGEGSERFLWTDTLDLSKFTEEFRWIPKHQLERFAEEMSTRLAQDKSHGFIYSFSRDMLNHVDNNEFVRRQGFRHLGVVSTMSAVIPDVPWTSFSYYKSANNAVTLRSKTDRSRGDIIPNFEKFDSFVLNVEGMDEGGQVLLPNGLDIKPYLHSYPSENVLYEHIRFDKRYRIIVQPYIAYLYRDKSLIKILVCGNKNGPADHGWSLVRGYYCYEGMDWYYWPVSKAYSPLEN